MEFSHTGLLGDFHGTQVFSACYFILPSHSPMSLYYLVVLFIGSNSANVQVATHHFFLDICHNWRFLDDPNYYPFLWYQLQAPVFRNKKCSNSSINNKIYYNCTRRGLVPPPLGSNFQNSHLIETKGTRSF